MKTKHGWIKSIRTSKAITFLAITDGQSDYQVTLTTDTTIIGELKVGASFIAKGTDSATPKGLYEFLAQELTIVGVSDDAYPIQPKAHTADFLRTLPALRGRTKGCQATWQMRHILSQTIHKTLSDFGYCQYFTPMITQADCEGAGQTFDVSSDWMQQKLTVSGQLHLEVGMMSLGSVYTFGPCFRAEKSATKKHLAEFWMLECEAAHLDLVASMDLVEKILKACVMSATLRPDLLQKLSIDSQHLTIADLEWPRITYRTICEQYALPFGEDISSELEQRIVQDYGRPVFITHYAKALKPFYMPTDAVDQGVAVCFDLIFPEVGELVGGSEREADYETLKESMVAAGLDLEKMDWYLQTRLWGSVPHAGFGLGFDRLVMYVCQLQKIHDAIPFPVAY